MNRYAKTSIVARTRGTCVTERRIYLAVRAKRIRSFSRASVEGERLDTLAGQLYGSGAYWWVIAAASGIGWAPQVPPGTWLTMPVSLAEVATII